jgi:hypothetical protein
MEEVWGLVVAAGIDGQFADEFAGGGVDDPDVQGELAGDVGAVGANTVLGTGGAVTRGGLGPGAAAKRRSPART